MDANKSEKKLFIQVTEHFKLYLSDVANESQRLMLVFGVVLFINYPLFYVIWSFLSTTDPGYESLYLRILASILCFPLILSYYCRQRCNLGIRLGMHWLTIYWYATACYCLPFFFTFMMLKNNGNTVWLMNSISAAFFVMLVFDTIASMVILSLGLALGIVVFMATSSMPFDYNPGTLSLRDMAATFLAVLFIGCMFSRSKQLTEKRVRQSKDHELENVLDKYESFVSNQEHDIRTPISCVVGLSEALIDLLTEPEHLELARYINESAKAQKAYQNSLLDGIYLFEKQTELYPRRFELKSVIEEVKSIYVCAFKKSQLNAEVIFDDALPRYLWGDWFRLQQILVCLLSNSVKFTEPGDNVWIRCKGILKQEREIILSIEIEDTGIGIDNDKLDSVFEPFNRLSLSNLGKYAGRGLGLTFVKKMVMELQGEINVTSVVGKGSVFHLLIPFEQSLSGEPTTEPRGRRQE